MTVNVNDYVALTAGTGSDTPVVMADLFLSYSRADRERAARVADALEAEGRSLWWDRQLASGADYASVIEREIAEARRVVVAWSGTARESLWVRAEANEALDQDKLVQINFDGAKPPLPFTMLHFLDFRGWGGGTQEAPWPELRAEIDGGQAATVPAQGTAVQGGVRPDPGGVLPVERRGPALQGLGKVAALGWVALAAAIMLALSVLLVVRGFISAEAFGMIAIGAAALSALLLAATVFLVLRISLASRI